MDVATKPTAQINNKTTHCYRDNTEKDRHTRCGVTKTGSTQVSVSWSENRGLYGHQNQRSETIIVINYVKTEIHGPYISFSSQQFDFLFGPFFLSLQFCKFWFSLSNCREERDQEEGDDDADIEQWWYEPRTSAVDASTAAASAAAMDGYAVPCGGYGDAAPDDVPAALHALPASSTSAAVPESSTAAPDARINRRD